MGAGSGLNVLETGNEPAGDGLGQGAAHFHVIRVGVILVHQLDSDIRAAPVSRVCVPVIFATLSNNNHLSPQLRSISSNVRPLVSGTRRQTTRISTTQNAA